jgi:formiminoglutamase
VYEDEKWPRAGAWLAGETVPNPIGRLAVLGVPLHVGSLTPGRCEAAPEAIRQALGRYSTYDPDAQADLLALAVTDHGDLPVADARPEEALEPIAEAVRQALGDADALVILGGDNSVTRPAVHGLGGDLARTGLLTLDAHFDLRDTEAGLSNGNPVRALLEDGIPGENVVQIGIQAFANSSAYGDVARRAGITVHTVDEVRHRGIEAVITDALRSLDPRCDAIHVDLDLDVLDRASAPGSPGSRPGGLGPWEARRAAHLCGRDSKVRAMDLVEVDPTKDVADATTLAAAACLLSFASGLRSRLVGG